MSLRVVVAAPFARAGRRALGEHEFVVALSLERDWFSPDQAKRVVDRGCGDGLLERSESELTLQFDPEKIEIPEEFEPDESVFQERSTFENVLEEVVAAGEAKQDAVAAINDIQRRLGVTVEVAAIVYANSVGVELPNVRDDVRNALLDEDTASN